MSSFNQSQKKVAGPRDLTQIRNCSTPCIRRWDECLDMEAASQINKFLLHHLKYCQRALNTYHTTPAS